MGTPALSLIQGSQTLSPQHTLYPRGPLPLPGRRLSAALELRLLLPPVPFVLSGPPPGLGLPLGVGPQDDASDIRSKI